MKKFIVILLAIVCALFVVGCQTESGENAGAKPPSYSQTEQGGGEQTDGGNNMEQQEDENNSEAQVVEISCGENILEIQLADTVSARALAKRLFSGDITISMRAYGGFEMVGALGFSLERQDVNMITQTGDVVLYSGNQLVIFYDSNSWAYTKIGHICGATRQSLENFFGGEEEAEVTFSLKDRG